MANQVLAGEGTIGDEIQNHVVVWGSGWDNVRLAGGKSFHLAGMTRIRMPILQRLPC
ncbi:MAG: hypothetical protein H8E40_06840 [Chloroflexi bacterium]|nr:hypothetical protein [Chloroflexota bacterium]